MSISYDVPPIIKASITRPANSTAYAAGDVMSDTTGDAHFTFNDFFNQSLSGTIESAMIKTTITPGTTSDINLWLFSADIDDVADNSANEIDNTQLLTCFKIVRFLDANWTDAESGSICTMDTPLVVKGTGTTVYGQLIAGGAYTPGGNSEVLTAEITMSRD